MEQNCWSKSAWWYDSTLPFLVKYSYMAVIIRKKYFQTLTVTNLKNGYEHTLIVLVWCTGSNWKYDVIAGTSIRAINAAFLVSHVIEKRKWENKNVIESWEDSAEKLEEFFVS